MDDRTPTTEVVASSAPIEGQPHELSNLLLTLPALGSGRFPTAPESLEGFTSWPGAKYVDGKVTKIEAVTVDPKAGEVPAPKFYIRSTVTGVWTDARTGQRTEGTEQWDVLAWSGPPDSLAAAQRDLQDRISLVPLGDRVVLVTTLSGTDAIRLQVGLVEANGRVDPLSIGGAGGLWQFKSVDEAVRALDDLVAES